MIIRSFHATHYKLNYPHGTVLAEIGEAWGELQEAEPMAAKDYRANVQLYNDYRDANINGDAAGAYVIDADTYKLSNFITTSDQAITNLPQLNISTKTLLVRNATTLTSVTTIQSPIDLNSPQTLPDTAQSVLLNAAGQVHTVSQNNIGLRAAYIKPKGTGVATVECTDPYDHTMDTVTRRRFTDLDAPCGPVSGADIVYYETPGFENTRQSGEGGFYKIKYYNPYCYGYNITYENPITAQLYYTNFNPKSPTGLGMYFQTTKVYDSCLGSTVYVPGGSSVRGRYGHGTYFGYQFDTWQVKAGMDPDFYQKESDHLRVGEDVKIIAINRKTGYIGSVVTTVGNAATGEGDAAAQANNRIDFPIGEIIMRPPNIKIKVERKYIVEAGLTQGEDRQYLVGFEGSSTKNDQWIRISTEWLDHDGSPLPVDLPGYTARIAKITSDKTLGDNIAEFPVKPGNHLEWLNIPGDAISNDHYYLHVNGKPPEDSPDFSLLKTIVDPNTNEVTTETAGPGILQYRPRHYVPIKVAMFDEAETRRRQNEQRQAEASGEPHTKIPPVYVWQHRPEMQFSVLELVMNQINRTDADGNVVDILPAGSDTDPNTIPGLASSDQSLQLLYDLQTSPYDPLDPFGYSNPSLTTQNPGNTFARDIILALGTEEALATFGAGQEAIFNNPDHLSYLSPEDFLTISMYQNSDSANILWEFAFEYLALDSRLVGYDNQTDTIFYVTADNPVVPFKAALLGYANRDPSKKTPATVRWSVAGSGSVLPLLQTDNDIAVFDTDLTMPTIKGAEGIVTASLVSSDTPINAKFKKVVVLAGEPTTITIATEGQAGTMRSDTLTATITVLDAHGNLVEDGTSVTVGVNEDALITQYDVETLNGQAVVKITGNAFPVTGAKLSVSSGQAVAEQLFDILPVTVAFANAPTSYLPEETQSVQLQVTTPSGNPVPDVMLTLTSTLGRFQEEQVETDVNGFASVNFHSGFHVGNGHIIARAGYGGGIDQVITVNAPPGNAPRVNTKESLIIGDASVPGSVTYTRFDGTSISMDYQVSNTLPVTGTASSTETVVLGDLSDPNIEPLVALYMNDIDPETNIVIDETGMHDATAQHVTIAQDNLFGVGKSFQFNKVAVTDPITGATSSSRLVIPPNPTLNKTQDVGFRFEFKPMQTDGILFDHGGAQSLTYETDGTLTYQITTANGTFSISSAVLPVGQWHTIAGRYQPGQLELEVNGVASTPVVATGAITYASASTAAISIGQNYEGLINGFRWFDWTASPLLQFDTATNTKDVVLDITGAGSIIVSSTGVLGSLQAGSSLKTMRVAMHIGSNRHYVSIISKAMFTDIGVQFTEVVSTTAPPIDPLGLAFNSQAKHQSLAQTILNAIIPPANAGVTDWLSANVGNAFDYAKTAVGFLIPYEDFIMLGKQLYYLSTGDWQNFSATDLAFSALGVATVIPIMKPLKPVLNPIKKVIAKYASKPIVKALAGVLGKAVNEGVKGRTDKLFSLLPFFLILVDLAKDPGALDALNLIIDSAESPDDLWAWIEYLNLPSDGWEGTANEIPELNLAGLNSDVTSNSTFFADISPLDFIVPSAHAAVKKKGLLVSVLKLKKLAKAVRLLETRYLKNGFKNLINVIKSIVKAMKETAVASVRKLTHEPSIIAAGIAGSAVAIRNIIKRTRNLRMSPLAIVAVIVYLESRMSDCADIVGCVPLEENVKLEIPKLYVKAFVQAILGEKEYIDGRRENGALFHLSMIAVKHLTYEVTGDSTLKVIEIEKERPVQLYLLDKTTKEAKPWGRPLGREVDIVLAGQGGSIAISNNNVWVEVKSYKSVSSYKGFWQPWNMNKSKYSNHRQFYLDRVGSSNNSLPGIPLNFRLANDFEWWLQQFKRKTITSYTPAQFTEVRKLLSMLPKGGGNNANYASLGYTSGKQNSSFTIIDVQNRFKPFNVKNWLLVEAKDQILGGISSELIDELITKSDDF